MLVRLTSPRSCAVKGALHVSLSGAGLPSRLCLGTKHVPEHPPAPTPPAGLRQLQGSRPQIGQRRRVVVHALKCGNRRGGPRPDGSSWPRESSEPLAGLSASLSLRQTSCPPQSLLPQVGEASGKPGWGGSQVRLSHRKRILVGLFTSAPAALPSI